MTEWVISILITVTAMVGIALFWYAAAKLYILVDDFIRNNSEK